MKKKIEILAPAGSYEGMKAAMNAGCDAVYIGGSSFGARAYANNLEEETLLQAIDEAHIRDKKLYLTVNTLLKEKEHKDKLYGFLDKFYLQGLDAVIVQDVGVLNFIHENFPDLPVHASTQMTLTMAEGANLLQKYGVTRLVTSRELSLKEIKTISDHTQLEIETFVHGALCYCYSGQCLMSSIIGGRSGNRGRCAQTCRMPYQLYSDGIKLSTDKEKYLLSPKDINTLAIIPDLVEAGIDSFKIEGRMKRPEYAAAVSYLYRKYVDLYQEIGKEEYVRYIKGNQFKEDMLILQDVYNRGGFSQGYGNTYNGKNMMALYRPNHSGVLVGEVKSMKGSQVTIVVKEKIHAQDILEIRCMEEDGYEFTVKDPHNPGDLLVTNVGRRPDTGKDAKGAGKRITKNMGLSFKIGDPVYRTKNNVLLNSLAEDYIQKEKRLGITGLLRARVGEKLNFTVNYQEISVTAYQEIVQEALKQPMTKEKLLAPLEKTKDTLYYFEKLELEADDHIFVPVAWLNEIRREAINLLALAVAGRYRRENLQSEMIEAKAKVEAKVVTKAESKEEYNQELKINQATSYGISTYIKTYEQFRVVLNTPEISSIYVEYDNFTVKELLRMMEEVEKGNKDFYLSLPHICRLSIYDRLKKDLKEIIVDRNIRGFLVKNFEEVALLQSLMKNIDNKKEIILNYNMYTYNKEAKSFWKKEGITHYTAPMELNYQELKALGIEDSDMVVYGYLPVMVSAQCLFKNTQGCRKQKAEDGKLEANQSGYITDRLGKNFFVQTNCRDCNNTIYNGQAMALFKQSEEIKMLNPRNIRLDFTMEDILETQKVVDLFVDRFLYGNDNHKEITEYTTGHFKRGVE